MKFLKCAARTHDRHEVPANFGTEKMAIGSMERESDGDASPTNHEGTLKSWAKGTRSSRYGSVNGIPGTNGNSRSGRTLPRTKELIDALMAASHPENEVRELFSIKLNFHLGSSLPSGKRTELL